VTRESGILSSDLHHEYKFRESAAFIQTALVEAGADNTYTQAETALRTRISGNFSSKISYQLKHNTDVTPSFEKNDQLITVSLVYDF
jgi:putative salt-induced outer membrane protein